jgi:hypothetical protein
VAAQERRRLLRAHLAEQRLAGASPAEHELGS